MARKREVQKEMPVTAEPATKPVRLDLPADIHWLLRKVAADANESMAAHARDVMIRYVTEEAKRRGIKS